MIMNYQYYQEINPTFHVIEGQTFEREKYTLVYTDTIDTNECRYDCKDEDTKALEELFAIHNADNRPRRTEIHSMSCGDIVVLERNGEKIAYVCDSFGWTKIDFNC